MEAVYPAPASALARGRRGERGAPPRPRARHRTVPVTFAEIKEVDEESELAGGAPGPGGRRRPDVLADAGDAAPGAGGTGGSDALQPLGRQFAEFRRRRQRKHVIREPPEEATGGTCAAPAAPGVRAASEPGAVGAPGARAASEGGAAADT